MESKPWTMHPTTVDDDEPPKDPGICQPTHQEFTEQDFEGHRAHTVFVGVHIPGGGFGAGSGGGGTSCNGSRRHSHRRHKHSSSRSESGEKADPERPITPPSQRVQFILGEEIDDGTHESHPLFSEMEELVKEGDEIEWKETARWIKFEEDVEEGGNRWSKPHVATLSLHSLFELRSLIINGTVILDMEANTLEQIADLVCENMVNSQMLPVNSRDKVRDALLRRHRHQHENARRGGRLPIIRSLADIGRNHSSSKSLHQQSTRKYASSEHSLHATTPTSFGVLDDTFSRSSTPYSSSAQTAHLISGSNKDQRGIYLAVPTGDTLFHGIGVTTWFHLGAGSSTSFFHHHSASVPPTQPNSTATITSDPTQTQVDDHQHHVSSAPGLTSLTFSLNTSNNGSGSCSSNTPGNANNKLQQQPPMQQKQLSQPDIKLSSLSTGSNNGGGNKLLSVPGRSPNTAEDMVKSPSSISMNRNASSNDLGEHRVNTHFMRKIPQGAEASNILVGEVDFLEKTLSAFIRLHTAAVMGDLTEVPVPTRFVFILLGPPGSHSNFHEIGRAMATLMSDEIFHEVAYRARKRDHLLAGIDEFLDAVTVLPPGEWDPTIRIEPPAAIPSQEVRKRPPETPKKEEPDEEEEEQRLREESGLSRTGRLFGGLINDVKRKAPWYFSDFKDALSLQCIASWIFLYFACLSPIITFGGLLSHATGKNMAAMESLVSGFVCGMGYGFFSGQPLTILGSTGPVLVFETIVFDFCKDMSWDYMSFRFWIGTWTALILLLLVAIDASALVCYITRFTEENFATLIAFIFIYKAVENVLSIGKSFPISPDEVYDCICLPPAGNDSVIDWAKLDKAHCRLSGGILNGSDCNSPESANVFLMSIILFMGTFTLSIILKDFKNALFFPANIRQVISDFSVIIAIFSMSILDYFVNISTPKLEVPEEFKPTLASRGWVIPPFNGNPIYTAVVAIFPALLGTILIFMDQQITAVIINRKENKLKKGCGYHLDLFVLAILIEICSIMGLPWFVAATVLSINHVNSLKLESECAAPGEKPQFLGVREQRVTHILIFLMIGCSVLLTSLLRHIPMPVLFGVFLYMGVASLKGLQFFDRILIFFMPVKYQPDHMFLRQVPLKRVHLFTAIQLACLIILWLIKSFSQTSILFPLMLVVMIGIRKLLDFVFTRRELKILDDIMPEINKKPDDDLKQLEDGSGSGLGGGAEDPNDSKNSQQKQQFTGKSYTTTISPIVSESSGISLVNGLQNKILSTHLKPINISEEVNRTTIWKQVNNEKCAQVTSPSSCYSSGDITIKVPSLANNVQLEGARIKRKRNNHQNNITSRSISNSEKKLRNSSTNNKNDLNPIASLETKRLSTMNEEDEETQHQNYIRHHHDDEVVSSPVTIDANQSETSDDGYTTTSTSFDSNYPIQCHLNNNNNNNNNYNNNSDNSGSQV